MIGADAAILGFIPCNFGDNLLHLVLGVLGLAAAVATPRRTAVTSASDGPAAKSPEPIN